MTILRLFLNFALSLIVFFEIARRFGLKMRFLLESLNKMEKKAWQPIQTHPNSKATSPT
jgi:hypothetical protein